jgi:hypothetical protein
LLSIWTTSFFGSSETGGVFSRSAPSSKSIPSSSGLTSVSSLLSAVAVSSFFFVSVGFSASLIFFVSACLESKYLCSSSASFDSVSASGLFLFHEVLNPLIAYFTLVSIYGVSKWPELAKILCKESSALSIVPCSNSPSLPIDLNALISFLLCFT